jgi:hypothetical protein
MIVQMWLRPLLLYQWCLLLLTDLLFPLDRHWQTIS